MLFSLTKCYRFLIVKYHSVIHISPKAIFYVLLIIYLAVFVHFVLYVMCMCCVCPYFMSIADVLAYFVRSRLKGATQLLM